MKVHSQMNKQTDRQTKATYKDNRQQIKTTDRQTLLFQGKNLVKHVQYNEH